MKQYSKQQSPFEAVRLIIIGKEKELKIPVTVNTSNNKRSNITQKTKMLSIYER